MSNIRYPGEVTEWFPADIKPVHIGVYQVHDVGFHENWYAYWDGVKFRARYFTPDLAYNKRNTIEDWVVLHRWRGIVK